MRTNRPSELKVTRVAFGTSVGPMGFVESGDGIECVLVGYLQMNDLKAALEKRYPSGRWIRSAPLADLLIEYSEGRPVDFRSVELAARRSTPFQELVLAACRDIGWGEWRSYGQLAEKVGSPGAARAVGSVMANNEWPIVVPCHRVLASNGRYGGYSAPLGIDFKKRLLRLEGISIVGADRTRQISVAL